MTRGRFHHRRAATLLLLVPLGLPGCAGAGDDDGDDDDGHGQGPHRGMMLQIESYLAVTRDRDTALGGNATGPHECSEGPYEHYEQPMPPGSPQLHLIGISAPTSDPGTLRYLPVEVHVSRPGTSILVLGSREETTWDVTTDPAATIEKIIIHADTNQTVNAPEGVPIEQVRGDESGTYGATRWPSYQATDLVDFFEAKVGRPMTSFRGCYYGRSFEIDEPDEIRLPHPESDAVTPTPLRGCEALTAESIYCMADSYDGLFMAGLDSGTMCRGEGLHAFGEADNTSLGWEGDYVYGCIPDRGIGRISVIDGTVDVAPIRCDATTSYDGGLLSMAFNPNLESAPFHLLVQFADFAAAARREPTRAFGLDPYASRIAVQGDQVYFAWHSTDTIQTAALEDGADITDIKLENYSNWIEGLDAAADGRILIGTVWTNPAINLYDATGGFQKRVPTPLDLGGTQGIKCYSPGD